ncbi:hypothetical protein F4813DRAFT_383234 [Daldinia decipiens]|uniref:uncharacterized protein n=1 Tax=Daldinia decipiens TaxID=326647 RepID=UPI0020C24D92|nr:uncharacterized protein F4813DRAFT_383234 [Daldinia decipiens]KAI1653443.1 hypothetical protein F4813DRAFT_383234 [Daldinia decipiens]
MSFDGIAEDQIRLDGEFHAVGAKYAWVSAKSIRTLELDGFIFNIVSGHDSARRFSTRLDLMKENRVKEAQQVCDRNEPPRVTSGRLSPGELRRQDTDSSQTLGHSQVLTLRYSEADLTPRQSQTAEKHDDTIHVITEPRPNSLSQRIDHEFHTFESIYRETSEPELVGSERSSDGVHNDDDRDRQLISDLFPGSPIAQVEETSDDNIASNVRHNDLVEAPSPLVKARAISGLPYVARAIRRPWSEDSGLNPSQNSSSSLVLDPTSSKTARAFYTNLKKYVNQHENDTPDYLPPTAPMLPQGLLQDHQATTELQGNRARNDELASTSNLNIQNTASTALSYFNTIYSREK